MAEPTSHQASIWLLCALVLSTILLFALPDVIENEWRKQEAEERQESARVLQLRRQECEDYTRKRAEATERWGDAEWHNVYIGAGPEETLELYIDGVLVPPDVCTSTGLAHRSSDG